MLKGYVTRQEYQKHIRGEWRTVHNLWPHIRNFAPGWGYSKAETDAFFEGYDGGKAQVDWARITGKPASYPSTAHALTGANHTAAGLTIGWVIKATGAATFAWGQLPHDKLFGLGDDDHAQYHNDARGDTRYYTQTQLQTSGLAQVHWDNITNEPAFYPPEYHYHVGKDVVSTHLVDLDDVEADDIFDVLPTAAIHGEGNYDWWGTWATTAPANTSAEIVVLAGDDKMLQLTDNSVVGGLVQTTLTIDAGHESIVGVLEFSARISALAKKAHVAMLVGAAVFIHILFDDDNDIKISDSVGAPTILQAYAANTWYKIRITFDAGAGYGIVFIDNVFIARVAMDFSGAYYADRIQISTWPVPTGYTFDVNHLKIFNLTV